MKIKSFDLSRWRSVTLPNILYSWYYLGQRHQLHFYRRIKEIRRRWANRPRLCPFRSPHWSLESLKRAPTLASATIAPEHCIHLKKSYLHTRFPCAKIPNVTATRSLLNIYERGQISDLTVEIESLSLGANSLHTAIILDRKILSKHAPNLLGRPTSMPRSSDPRFLDLN